MGGAGGEAGVRLIVSFGQDTGGSISTTGSNDPSFSPPGSSGDGGLIIEGEANVVLTGGTMNGTKIVSGVAGVSITVNPNITGISITIGGTSIANSDLESFFPEESEAFAEEGENSFRCGVCETDSNGIQTCEYKNITWRFFFVNCPKSSFNCSAQRGAWVPAITVCNQRLFS